MDLSQFIESTAISKLTHFDELCRELYREQRTHNPVFKAWCDGLPEGASLYKGMNFLPVSFFKTREVKTGKFKEETVFFSSNTTGLVPSRHFVKSLEWYRKNHLSCFRHFYGEPSSWCILGLLPSYHERPGASLVKMTDDMIKESGNPFGGFYLDNFHDLQNKLHQLKRMQTRTILLGVGFALLDFIENFGVHFPSLIIMETGGMKGRRAELIREELHARLKAGFGVNQIHSEYGMTEMMSQAYSRENGKFFTPPTLKILIADLHDPFKLLAPGKTGQIHIIDLANSSSCAFIQTSDLGRINEDGSFEVLGRIDNSELRGCSLLYD